MRNGKVSVNLTIASGCDIEMAGELTLNLSSLAVFTIFLSSVIHIAPSSGQTFSCERDANGFDLDSEKIVRLAGDWYEVTRAPSSDVPACVKVTAPKAITNNNYTLELDYVNNVNKGWKRVKENLDFPWNDETKKGFFNLYYSGEDVSVNITYKLIKTNYIDIAVLCGYASVSPISFFKIMSRERHVNETVKTLINELAKLFGAKSELTWVDQSDRCNGAMKLLPVWTILLVILYEIFKRR